MKTTLLFNLLEKNTPGEILAVTELDETLSYLDCNQFARVQWKNSGFFSSHKDLNVNFSCPEFQNGMIWIPDGGCRSSFQSCPTSSRLDVPYSLLDNHRLSQEDTF